MATKCPLVKPVRNVRNRKSGIPLRGGRRSLSFTSRGSRPLEATGPSSRPTYKYPWDSWILGIFYIDLFSLSSPPFYPLNCSSFSSDSSASATYECYGVSNHSGTLHGGHYVAACRHPYNADAWHMYNDRSVSGQTLDRVITAEAYLLFFQRVSTWSLSDKNKGCFGQIIPRRNRA